jgi:hypothetical protein
MVDEDLGVNLGVDLGVNADVTSAGDDASVPPLDWGRAANFMDACVAGLKNGLLLSLYIAIHGKSRNVSDLNMPCLFTFDLRK